MSELKLYAPDEGTTDTATVAWEPWVQVYGGGRFYYVPEVGRSVINIRSIATALSRQPRWGGHTHHAFSVAQHSVETARWIRENGGNLFEQLMGLMHDATEYVLCDVPSPAKRQLPEYKALEGVVWAQISYHFFGAVLDIPPIVKKADMIMLATEGRDLMRPALFMPELEYGADAKRLRPWWKWYAKYRFLKEFNRLTRAIQNEIKQQGAA